MTVVRWTDLTLVLVKLLGEIHLAGHSKVNDQLIDTHSAPVSEPVWQLYVQMCERLPNVPCLIEWDNELPLLCVLMDEQKKAADILCNAGQRVGGANG